MFAAERFSLFSPRACAAASAMHKQYPFRIFLPCKVSFVVQRNALRNSIHFAILVNMGRIQSKSLPVLFSYLRIMSLPQVIEQNMQKMLEELQHHAISRAYLFGSALSDKFNDASDIDILLEFNDDCDPLEKGESLGIIQEKLEDILLRPVDVVSASAIKNPYFLSSIKQNQLLIYGK
jgi:predicted nucleotidyltransferase